MILEFDFHMHSRYSFDGIMSPNRMVQRAKGQGLSGIAITDHNTIAGGLEAADLNGDPSFLVIVGTEICTEVGDILGLFLDKEIESRRSQDVVDAIHAQGGLAILPHPFQHYRNLQSSLLDKLDAVEVYNGRDKLDYSQRIQNEIAQPFNLAILGNSDAHMVWEIGRARSRIDLSRFDWQSLRSAIIEKHCFPCRVLPRSKIAIYISKMIKYIKRAKDG